jgi:DNA-binding NarL/FixJ family response regulator
MSQTKHIAIVDDHTMFRKGLCVLINLFPGYSVILDTVNGREFIALLDPLHLPDILLLDIVMPEMDGYALTAWVCKHYPSIRILALSTMDTELSIIRMIRAGARGYLHKDAEPGELKQAFEAVLTYGYYYNEEVARKIFRPTHSVYETSDLIGILTERELDFLRLACSEKTYYEIAREMFVSVRTIDGYRDSLFQKLHVSTRVGLVLFAVRHGIVHT